MRLLPGLLGLALLAGCAGKPVKPVPQAATAVPRSAPSTTASDPVTPMTPVAANPDTSNVTAVELCNIAAAITPANEFSTVERRDTMNTLRNSVPNARSTPVRTMRVEYNSRTIAAVRLSRNTDSCMNVMYPDQICVMGKWWQAGLRSMQSWSVRAPHYDRL